MIYFNCDRDCDHLSPEGKCMYGYCYALSQAVMDGRPMCERLREIVIEHERNKPQRRESHGDC